MASFAQRVAGGCGYTVRFDSEISGPATLQCRIAGHEAAARHFDLGNFLASIATMWAAVGRVVTYVAAAVASRQQTYEGILSLIEGLEAELTLVSEWAAGDEGNQHNGPWDALGPPPS
jgi:hypothetical protein